MMYALLTLIAIIFFGGLAFWVLDIVSTWYMTWLMTSGYVEYFSMNDLNFLYDYIHFIPVLIVIIAIASAVIIELRRKNPDAYFSI